MLDKAKMISWIKEEMENQSDPAGDVAHCLFYLRIEIESGTFDAPEATQLREERDSLQYRYDKYRETAKARVLELEEERDKLADALENVLSELGRGHY